MNPNKPPSPRVISALICIQIFFGLNYIFSKLIMQSIPPMMWGFIRAFGTAIILSILSIYLKKFNWRHAVNHSRELIFFSILGITLNQGCFLAGLKLTTPTNSALLNTLIPVFTILIVTLRGQEKTKPIQAIGYFLAFIGVIALNKVEDFQTGNETFIGDMFTLVNALFYSLFLTFSQDFMRKNDYIWTTTWLFIFGSIGFFFAAIPDFISYTYVEIPTKVIFSIIINIVAGTVFPYILISFTLSRVNSSLVALFIYIQPIVAAILSFIFFKDVITIRTAIAGCLIFTGVILALSRRKKKQIYSTPTPIQNNDVVQKKSAGAGNSI